MTPTIAERLRRINSETSSRLSGVASGDSPATVGATFRLRVLGLALGAFVRSFFGQKNFARGKEGFVLSGCEAMEALVKAVKVWELSFRRSEGGQHLPPTNEAEVEKLSARYASWTAP